MAASEKGGNPPQFPILVGTPGFATNEQRRNRPGNPLGAQAARIGALPGAGPPAVDGSAGPGRGTVDGPGALRGLPPPAGPGAGLRAGGCDAGALRSDPGWQ